MERKLSGSGGVVWGGVGDMTARQGQSFLPHNNRSQVISRSTFLEDRQDIHSSFALSQPCLVFLSGVSQQRKFNIDIKRLRFSEIPRNVEPSQCSMFEVDSTFSTIINSLLLLFIVQK